MINENLPFGKNKYLNWEFSPSKDQTSGLDQLTSYHEVEHTIINSSTIYGGILNSYALLLKFSNEKEKFEVIHKLLESNSKTVHECGATWTSIEKSLLNHSGLTVESILLEYRQYKPYYVLAESLVKEIKGPFFRRMIVSTCVIFSFQGYEICSNILSDFENPNLIISNSLVFPDDRFLYIVKHFKAEEFTKICKNFIDSKSGHPDFNFLQAEFEKITEDWSSHDIQRMSIEFCQYIYQILQSHFNNLGSPSYEIQYGFEFYKTFTIKILDYLLRTEQNESILKNIMQRFDYMSNPAKIQYNVALKYELEILQLAAVDHYATILFPSQIGRLKSQILQGDDFKRLNIMFRNSETIQNLYRFPNEEHKSWIESRERVIVFLRKLYKYEDSFVVLLIPFDNSDELEIFLEEKDQSIKTICCISHSSIGLNENEWKIITEITDYVYFLNDLSLIDTIDGYEFKENEKILFTDILIEYDDKKAVVLVFCYYNTAESQGEIHLVPCTNGYVDFIIGYLIGFCENYEYSDTFLNVDIYINIQSVLRSIYMEESKWHFRTYTKI